MGVLGRLILADDQWEQISAHIIGDERARGSFGRDNRMFLEAALWIMRKGQVGSANASSACSRRLSRGTTQQTRSIKPAANSPVVANTGSSDLPPPGVTAASMSRASVWPAAIPSITEARRCWWDRSTRLVRDDPGQEDNEPGIMSCQRPTVQRCSTASLAESRRSALERAVRESGRKSARSAFRRSRPKADSGDALLPIQVWPRADRPLRSVR